LHQSKQLEIDWCANKLPCSEHVNDYKFHCQLKSDDEACLGGLYTVRLRIVDQSAYSHWQT